MSLVPIYVYEVGTELPNQGTYFVVAANGMFMHKDVTFVKALVRFELENVPLLRDFVPPKPKSIPVYIYDNECGELPEEENYFVIAKNGVHLHKDQKSGKSFAKSSFLDIPNLGYLQTKVHFELPKIPVEIMWRCLLFFRRVWYVHKAEAAVVLFYTAKTQEYYLHCPQQQVSGGGVDYGIGADESKFINEMRQKGFNRVGTIHSHCDFNAYHSNVDTGDEAEWPDGVHVTIGHVNSKHFSLMSSLVVNDNRFKVDPSSIINGLKQKSKKVGFNQGDAYFDVTLTTDQREALIGLYQHEIEEEWLPKVKPRHQGGFFGGTMNTSVPIAPEAVPQQILVAPQGAPLAELVEAMNAAEVSTIVDQSETWTHMVQFGSSVCVNAGETLAKGKFTNDVTQVTCPACRTMMEPK